MLSKKYKLTWKDINFIFKKQKIIPWRYFSFFVWPQYPNRDYNQFGIQIPLKVSKRSTKRNFIKRLIYEFIREKELYSKTFNWKYLKIFIITNKKAIPLLTEILNKKDKLEKKENILNMLKESFKSLNKFKYESFFKIEKISVKSSRKKEKITAAGIKKATKKEKK